MPDTKLISILTPVYNEQDNLNDVYQKVREVMSKVSDRYEYEHVFSDNGSQDGSREILRRLAAEDKRVKVIFLSNNFGVTRSTLNAYRRCSGDAVVQLDADLQNPPEMILDFLKLWGEGNAVVYGICGSRDELWVMKTVRKVFYRLAGLVSASRLKPDVGDFRLMDRVIIDEVLKIHDYKPYLRGIIANLGFKQKGIPYKMERRRKGKTSTNFFYLLDYGINGIISHSNVLLRLSTLAGAVLMGASGLLIVFYSFWRVVGKNPAPGITTVVVLILFFGGMQMIFLGILGEYIARIYDQSIGKPLVIEEELLNV